MCAVVCHNNNKCKQVSVAILFPYILYKKEVFYVLFLDSHKLAFNEDVTCIHKMKKKKQYDEIKYVVCVIAIVKKRKQVAS